MAQIEMYIVSCIAAVALTGVLVAATWSDVRTHHIPNKLVVAGVVAGVILNASAPAGLGFFSTLQPGGLGFWMGVAGLFTGAAILLPLYLIHGMGAGDVKLMGVAGAFLGPLSVVDAAVFSLAAGGVLAGTVALYKGTLRQALENIRFMVADAVMQGVCGRGIRITPVHQSAGRVPYALAIASGTLLHLVWVRNGYSLFAR